MTDTTFDFARAQSGDYAVGHEPDVDAPLAIGADGTVLVEQPLARFHVRVTACRQRCMLLRRAAHPALTRLA